MKIAFFDCFSGASGDMILGALIDAGFDMEKLNEELKKLGVGNYKLGSKRVHRSEITGTKFDVSIKDDKKPIGSSNSANQNLQSINSTIEV